MCQDTDLGGGAGDSNDDDAEAEQDELLLESAGDVIPKFGAALTPDDFVMYFPNVLKLMSNRTVTHEPYDECLYLMSIVPEETRQYKSEVLCFWHLS